ncbi:MAG TPA: hypothetical protein VJ183_11030 [Chloroflexia bacterium]|nr:hypothetical protein [Chloroflexia bacterium]
MNNIIRKTALFTLAIMASIALLSVFSAKNGSGLAILSFEPVSAAAANEASPQPPDAPVGAGFTYQGKLADGANPANGSFDFRFDLYDAPTGGNLLGSVLANAQTVSNGLFTANLDFSDTQFDGNSRYLQIGVKPAGGSSYTTLSPRQPITPVPYALYALKAKSYKNVVVVAKSGGDFTSLTTALNSITDASATNRYLVKVGPGSYGRATMKPYVDIEGSGQDTTVLSDYGYSTGTSGTIVGANNTEIRSLTVENLGGDYYAVAMYADNTSPRLLDVTLKATNGQLSNWGLYVKNGAAPTLTNVTISASGGSMSNAITTDKAGAIVKNSSLTVSGASYNYAIDASNYGYTGGLTIENSQIFGPGLTIRSAYSNIWVAASRLSGGPVQLTVGNPVVCAGVHDENFTFFANSCPQ